MAKAGSAMLPTGPASAVLRRLGRAQALSAVRHSGWPQPLSFLAMDSPAA